MNIAANSISDGTEVFFMLHDQKVLAAQKEAPKGFYVKGIMEGGRYVPSSGVLGIGELAKAGRYGWLELNSREFFPMESDQRANTPFVKGYITDQGFVPSEREVINTP